MLYESENTVMAGCRLDIFHPCVFQVMSLAFHVAMGNEYLSLDTNLTRSVITTILGSPVNLGCYVTKINPSQTATTLNFTWFKDNLSVTQSPRSKIHGNILVVRPKRSTDFGQYTCNVTNGVSSTQCQIVLLQGFKNDGPKNLGTGCVNVSVLMPVLAVAVLSCLLFVHLVIRHKEPKILVRMASQRKSRRKSAISMAHPHEEQRQRSRDLLYNSFENGTLNNNDKKQEVVSVEMHVGSESNPIEDNFVDERKKKRRSGFSNKSFTRHSIDMDDAEDGSQASDESKNSSGKSELYNKSFKTDSCDVGDEASVNSSINENNRNGASLAGYYNKTYKNDSVDSNDGEVFSHPLEETVGVDKPKGGKAKGFINKTYHSDSMDLDDGPGGAPAAEEDKNSKTLQTESVDVPKNKEGAKSAKDPFYEEISDYAAEHVDTYF